MSLTPKQRQDAINNLTTNCSCWKHEGDRDVLNGLSDDKIEHLVEGLEEATHNADVVELVTNGVFDEEKGFGFRIDPETGNPQMAVLNKEVCYDDEEENEDETPPVPPTKKKMTGNSKGKDMTPQQVFNMLPPEMRKQYQRAINNEKKRKAHLIEKLTSNIEDDDEKELISNSYQNMDVEVLEKIVANQARTSTSLDSDDLPDYSGVGSYTHNSHREQELENDVLDLPTTNGHYNTGIEDRKSLPRAFKNSSRMNDEESDED